MSRAKTTDQSKAADRVYQTFARWKRHKVPVETALYHTMLDIRYRHGGLRERLAFLRLRWTVRLFGREPHRAN